MNRRPFLRRLIKLLPEVLPVILDLLDIDLAAMPEGAVRTPRDMREVMLRTLRAEVDGMTDEDIAELLSDD